MDFDVLGEKSNRRSSRVPLHPRLPWGSRRPRQPSVARREPIGCASAQLPKSYRIPPCRRLWDPLWSRRMCLAPERNMYLWPIFYLIWPIFYVIYDQVLKDLPDTNSIIKFFSFFLVLKSYWNFTSSSRICCEVTISLVITVFSQLLFRSQNQENHHEFWSNKVGKNYVREWKLGIVSYKTSSSMYCCLLKRIMGVLNT